MRKAYYGLLDKIEALETEVKIIKEKNSALVKTLQRNKLIGLCYNPYLLQYDIGNNLHDVESFPVDVKRIDRQVKAIIEHLGLKVVYKQPVEGEYILVNNDEGVSDEK